MNKLTIILTVIGLMCTWTCYSADSKLPTVTVSECETPPLLDGKLNDACWSKAAELTKFHGLGKAKKDMGTATRVKITRDKDWLYMGFICKNDMMKHLSQRVFDHDGPVNNEDDVELYFDPGTDGEMYYHLMLSWANVQKEQKITKKGGREMGWNPPWHSATARNEKGWTAEVAIPLFVLTSYGDMTKARMNITRARNTTLLDIMNAPVGIERDFGSWAPLNKSAHDPSRFGYLKGLEGLKVTMPFLPTIERAEVGEYKKDGANQIYKVKIGLRTHTVTGGKVNLAVNDKPKSGATKTIKLSVDMKGMTTKEVTAVVPVTAMVQRNVTVELESGKEGEIWQKYQIPDTSVLTLMGTPLVDRNYYTDEENARVRCDFGMPATALKGMKLTVKDKDGKELAATKNVKPRTTVDVPLKKLDLGRHTLSIVLSGTKDETLAEDQLKLVKLKPNPGSETKVDNFRRILLKNGEPFFAFGLVATDIGSSNETYFKAMADAGHNTIIRCYAVSPWWNWAKKSVKEMVADTLPYLDMAKKYDLMVVDWAGNVMPGAAYDKGFPNYGKGHAKPEYIKQARKIFEEQVPDIEKVGEILKKHPNYLLYMNGDEQNLPNSEMRILGAEWYYGVKSKLDPYHPAFLNYARYIPPEKKWLKYGEVLSYDVYISPGWGTLYSTPNYMSLMTMEVKKRADAEGKVLWMVPISEGLDTGRTPRRPNPNEKQCETYLTLIHGTKGLLFFCTSSLFSQDMWNKLGSLAKEVKQMAPALLEGAVPQEITYKPVALDIQAQKLPDVQATLFKYPDGRYLLLAANSQWYPVETTFKIKGLKDGKTVNRMFGKSNLEVKDGVFDEKIERYGTRAYILDIAKSADDKPLLMTVTAKSCRDEGEPIKLLMPQIEKTKKRKNVMPNPSFEDRTVSGLPDFVIPTQYLTYPMVGHPEAVWGMDTDNPYHGKVSLRMRRETIGNGKSVKCRGAQGVFYPPKLENATPYVFSVYMRGKKNGDKAWVRVLGKTVTFPLTTEWERYEIAGSCGPTSEKNGGCQSYLIYPVTPGAEIWVDAMQIEAGTKSTEFTGK